VRAERLLRILLMLQVYESLTAGELARRLQVSARTIQPDLPQRTGGRTQGRAAMMARRAWSLEVIRQV
jgi:DeoR/GlpR family transcriptional regulator of sugar metabolism